MKLRANVNVNAIAEYWRDLRVGENRSFNVILRFAL
jgi:hypothetical protein